MRRLRSRRDLDVVRARGTKGTGPRREQESMLRLAGPQERRRAKVPQRATSRKGIDGFDGWKARGRHGRRAWDRAGDRRAARRRGRDPDAARARPRAAPRRRGRARRRRGAPATSATARRSTPPSPPPRPSAARSTRSSPTAVSAARTRTARTTASTTSSRRTSSAPITASAPRCATSRRGRSARDVVVISSILARIAVGGYTGYSASKAGLLGLVRSFAAELARRQRPGERDLPRLGRHRHGVGGDRRLRRGDRRHARGGLPRGDARRAARRMSEPADIAGTVAWLLSPDARGVTGQAIDQNGGAWVG